MIGVISTGNTTLLCDRRDELSTARVQALNRRHRLFLEPVPGSAPAKKSASKYTSLLATVRPRITGGAPEVSTRSPQPGERR